jgi:hypothetical protein
VPFVELKYEIGKYYRGKVLGMPDCILDVIVFDENNNFHLFELKRLYNSEVWNGKIFGQIMLYDFLFSSEPWNELAGRFVITYDSNNSRVKGDIGRILIHLGSYGRGQTAKENDRKAKFVTWNLVVCGGAGNEIIEANPIINSYLLMANSYFKEEVPEFCVHHFYRERRNWKLQTFSFDDALDLLISEK